MTPAYLFADIETTGLNPHKDLILEIALVPVDRELRSVWRKEELPEVRECFQLVIPVPRAWAHMDKFVLDMHTKNGLLDAIEKNPLGAPESMTYPKMIDIADGRCREYVNRVFPDAKPRSIILGGNSVHFDLGFFTAQMPALRQVLSHRCFDVSALKMFAQDHLGMQFEKDVAHRALADIDQSLSTARSILYRVKPTAAEAVLQQVAPLRIDGSRT